MRGRGRRGGASRVAPGGSRAARWVWRCWPRARVQIGSQSGAALRDLLNAQEAELLLRAGAAAGELRVLAQQQREKLGMPVEAQFAHELELVVEQCVHELQLAVAVLRVQLRLAGKRRARLDARAALSHAGCRRRRLSDELRAPAVQLRVLRVDERLEPTLEHHIALVRPELQQQRLAQLDGRRGSRHEPVLQCARHTGA